MAAVAVQKHFDRAEQLKLLHRQIAAVNRVGARGRALSRFRSGLNRLDKRNIGTCSLHH
jgi:hypothetical protein